MEAVASGAIPSSVPFFPECASPQARRFGSARKTAPQSATKIPRYCPATAVTRPSVSGKCGRPGPSSASTTATLFPCTCCPVATWSRPIPRESRHSSKCSSSRAIATSRSVFTSIAGWRRVKPWTSPSIAERAGKVSIREESGMAANSEQGLMPESRGFDRAALARWPSRPPILAVPRNRGGRNSSFDLESGTQRLVHSLQVLHADPPPFPLEPRLRDGQDLLALRETRLL